MFTFRNVDTSDRYATRVTFKKNFIRPSLKKKQKKMSARDVRVISTVRRQRTGDVGLVAWQNGFFFFATAPVSKQVRITERRSRNVPETSTKR